MATKSSKNWDALTDILLESLESSRLRQRELKIAIEAQAARTQRERLLKSYPSQIPAMLQPPPSKPMPMRTMRKQTVPRT